jgi:hypothetical protein
MRLEFKKITRWAWGAFTTGELGGPCYSIVSDGAYFIVSFTPRRGYKASRVGRFRSYDDATDGAQSHFDGTLARALYPDADR